MRLTTGHPDWLTVIQPPAYAPELNPVEGAWSVSRTPSGTSPPAPQTSSPPRCGISWTASSGSPLSSPDSSVRPDSPSNQNRQPTRPRHFKLCSGSLLSWEVEVQAAACRDRVHQGLKLGERGRRGPCRPPELQRDPGESRARIARTAPRPRRRWRGNGGAARCGPPASRGPPGRGRLVTRYQVAFSGKVLGSAVATTRRRAPSGPHQPSTASAAHQVSACPSRTVLVIGRQSPGSSGRPSGDGDHPVVGVAVPAQPLMAHVRGLHLVASCSAGRTRNPCVTRFRPDSHEPGPSDVSRQDCRGSSR